MSSPALPCLLATAIVGAAFAAPLAAADRWVAIAGVDAPGCLDPLAPCRTIQHAVDEAADGDTVQVAPGTYAEHLVVTKSITIAGATGTVVTGSNLDRVLTVSGAASARITGLVLADGLAPGGASGVDGGAVQVLGFGTELEIVDSTLRSSSAGVAGAISTGGILRIQVLDHHRQPGSERRRHRRLVGGEAHTRQLHDQRQPHGIRWHDLAGRRQRLHRQLDHCR